MFPRILFSLILLSTVVFANPLRLQSRAPNVRILMEGEGSCNTEGRPALIKSMIADAKKIAQSAIDTLNKPGVEKSSGFVALFGPHANPKDIAQKHFEPVKDIPDSPQEVLTTKRLTANDLTFICPAFGDPKDKSARMSTQNWNDRDDSDKNNLIKIFPNSFWYSYDKDGHTIREIALSVDEAVANIKANPNDAKGWFSEAKVPMAFTLVHEVQHADVLIGAANHCNDVDSDKVLPNGKKAKAYGLQQIQRLTDADKVKNAQNYAWFGLLTLGRPDLFTDDCEGKPGPIPRAHPLEARAGTCKLIQGDFSDITYTDGEF